MSNKKIDPKDLMAVERSTTALIGVAISLIVLGFVVEKFELFLNILVEQDKYKKLPQLSHIEFYNYLGIAIVCAGIALALYTYRYYIKWIKYLENEELDTDKSIYFYLSIFIATIGAILLVSMIVM
jgi:uncharacterized membrane protein YidH (DUF202 family)